MPVIVTAQKTVSSRSPYIGQTFQRLAEGLAGREGYLGGFETTDDSVTVDATVGSFLQRGFVSDTLEAVSGLAVPTQAEPWFLVGSVSDDDPSSGATISVTASLTTALSGVVLSYKSQGVWRNPVPVDIASSFRRAVDKGVEVGAQPSVELDGGGLVTEQRVSGGQLVGAAGFRRPLLPGATESGKSFAASPVPAHPDTLRREQLVLREVEEQTSQIERVLLLVGSTAGSVITKTTVDTRFGYYANRAGALATEFFAWGAGSDILVQGGRAAEGFAATTLLTAGGSVTEVWLAGERASDGAVIVVFAAGGNISMASFNASTGALVNAAVVIDTQANTANRVRAAMDSDELVHVVYQHFEGTDNQTYYTKRGIASGSFAAAAVTPTIAAGTSTSRNDTYPDIDVDRQGRAHVVYASGSTGNEFGDLAYLVLDQFGNVLTDRLLETSSAIGKETDAEEGFVATAYSSIARARVAVTPFDEVFVAMVADESGSFDQLLLYSPGFRQRLGFDIVNLPDGAEYSCDIVADEAGALHISGMDVSLPNISIRHQVLDPVYAPEGRVGDSVVSTRSFTNGITAGPTAIETDISLHRGHAGALQLSSAYSSTAGAREVPQLLLGGRLPLLAAADTLLASFDIPSDAAGVVDGDEIGIFAVRPKGLSYPFLVGEGGDLAGVNSLKEAVSQANAQGGRIVIRKGDYRNLNGGSAATYTLLSGVSVEGEDQVYLPNASFEIGVPVAVALDNIAGNILEFLDTVSTPAIRAGDLINITDGSGFHRVIAKLPASPTYPARFLVTDSVPGGAAPSGTTTRLLPSGNRLENLALDAKPDAISARSAAYNVLRELAFVGDFSAVIFAIVNIEDCYRPLLSGIDFRGVNLTSSSRLAIRLDANEVPVVEKITGGDGAVNEIDVYPDNVEPTLSDMTNIAIVSTVGGSRTTPIVESAVDDGDATGITDDTDRHTAVGKVVKVQGTGAALHLQDHNTRQETVRDVPFSDSTDSDGSTLPAGFGVTTETSSLLRALRLAEHNHSSQFGGVLLSGGAPTAAGGVQVDVAAASYFSNGLQLDSGALSNNDAAAATTTYFYYLDENAALVRSTSLLTTSANLVLIATATTDGGGTAFDSFTDLRVFFGKEYQRGALVVGTDTEFAHFTSLQSALRYLELTSEEEVSEVVIVDQLSVAATELPITVNLETSNIKSLIIRAIGDDAGILVADGATADVLSFTGLAAKAAGNSPGQKASLVLDNLLIENDQTTFPITSGESTILLAGGYFTDVTIKNIRTQPNRGGISNFVSASSSVTIDRLTVEDCIADDIGLSGVIVDDAAVIEDLHVRRNEFRFDGQTTGVSWGIYVGEAVRRAWVEDNFTAPSRHPLVVPVPFRYAIEIVVPRANLVERGRVVRNNNLYGGDSIGGNVDGVHLTEGSGTGAFGQVDISGNRISGDFSSGINSSSVTEDNEIVISENTIYGARDNGILVWGIGGEIIKGNKIYASQGNGVTSSRGNLQVIDNDFLGVATAEDAIDINVLQTVSDGSPLISGNKVRGIWENGIRCFGERPTISGNTVEVTNAGATLPYGIRLTSNNDEGGLVANNTVKSNYIGITFNQPGMVIQGNNVLVTDTTNVVVDACALLYNPGTTGSCVVTGNRFEIPVPTDVASTDSSVVKITGNVTDCVFTGNWTKAYVGADYSGSSTGQHCLLSDCIRQTITGNLFENRGAAGKETVRFTPTAGAGGRTTLIGNMFRNINASPIYVLTAHTIETGDTSNSVPPIATTNIGA